jgi:cell division protease FtsH
MSHLGPISFDADSGISGMGQGGVKARSFGNEYATLIDKEVTTIIKQCYEDCKTVVKKYSKYLDIIAGNLIEHEVLEYEEFSLLVIDIINPKPKLAPISSQKASEDTKDLDSRSSPKKKPQDLKPGSMGSPKVAPA